MIGYQWKTFVPPMMFNNSGNMGGGAADLTDLWRRRFTGCRVVVRDRKLPAFSVGPANDHPTLVDQGGLQEPDDHRHHFRHQRVCNAGDDTGVFAPADSYARSGFNSTATFLAWRTHAGDRLQGLADRGCGGVDLPSEQVPILLLFSALPPAVLNFLVAERFNQEPQKVASIVLIANFASIMVIPVVLWVIL